MSRHNCIGLILCFLIFAGFILILGCGNGASGPGKTVKLSNPDPENRSDNVPVLVIFTWTYYDTIADPIFYDFYLGVDNPPQMYASHLTDTFCGPCGLMSDTTYYWKVIAHDNEGDTVRSETWQFRTADSLTFPTEIGNSWSFSQTYFNFGFEPDTLPNMVGEPLTDTMIGSAITEIVGLDTLYDSIEVYVFRTDWTSGGSAGEMFEFCQNKSDGFYVHAYHNIGWIGPPKTAASPEVYYIFNGMKFGNLDELRCLIYSQVSMPFAKVVPDTNFEEPPIRELAYPIEVGSRWMYRSTDLGHVWDMEKEVIGKENIDLPAGSFDCFKIRWFWDTDGDGEWDNTIDGYDYVTGAGIVKREFTIFDIMVTNYLGDTLGTHDVSDRYEMTGFESGK